MNTLITNKKIPLTTKLKYLIIIPCVNRLERNAINVIEITFKEFEKSGLFDKDLEINFTIRLFESGSKNVDYLEFINRYLEKYPHLKIEIIYSAMALNGVSNTHRMLFHVSKIPNGEFDFVLWMDDDIYVCKNFMKNADIWIKNYANFSIFSSLYVSYDSEIIQNRKYIRHALLRHFHGTCCTIIKPQLTKYIVPYWYDKIFEMENYTPDIRFKAILRRAFPNDQKICVSYPSFVQHINIGSSIYQNKAINVGHKAREYIGSENDPELYIHDIGQN
jgi:hypothetical protein